MTKAFAPTQNRVVFYYLNDEGVWEEDSIHNHGGGEAVHLNGNSAVVGDPTLDRGDAGNTGGVKLYGANVGPDGDQQNWDFDYAWQYDILEEGDNWGRSVAVGVKPDGLHIHAGAPRSTGNYTVLGNLPDSSGFFIDIFPAPEVGPVWQPRIYEPADPVRGMRYGMDLSLDGDRLLVSAITDDGVGTVYFLEYTEGVNRWEEKQKITNGRSGELDNFGTTTSLDGDTAVVGVPMDDDSGIDCGAAYVFARAGRFWDLRQKLLPDDGGPGDNFGSAVCLENDTAIIGSPENYSGIANNNIEDVVVKKGKAYVFTRDGSTWNLQDGLVCSTPAKLYQNYHFGRSVDLSGDTALIGAPTESHENGSGGAAYVFTRQGEDWIEQQRLESSDSHGGDDFGHSVSVDGDTALIGARDAGSTSGEIRSGQAYIFTRDSGVWTEQAILFSDDIDRNDDFGYDVELKGNRALIGARFDQDRIGGREWSVGAGYLFTGSGANWTQTFKLIPHIFYDDRSAPWAGHSVDLEGDIAVLGGPTFGNSPQFNGAVFLYDLTSDHNDDGLLYANFTQRLELPEHARDYNDQAGFDVSLDGDTLLVGVPGEEGGDALGEVAEDQGAVYVYRLSLIQDSDFDNLSDTWEQLHGYDPEERTYNIGSLDVDGDGFYDLFEIFQGTDRHSASSSAGLASGGADSSNQTFSMLFRRATGDTGVTASYKWSVNLTDWYFGGETGEGISVAFSEEVVESHADYEIVKVTATVSQGTAEHVYIRVELTPSGYTTLPALSPTHPS